MKHVNFVSKQRGSRSAEFALLYGSFYEPTEKDKRLYDIAKQYHYECEAYDKTVCNYIDEATDTAIPIDSREKGLINKHALAVRERIIKENPDLTKQGVHDAIVKHINV